LKYVGFSVGLTVGNDEGELVGAGVAFPGKYVGSRVGELVGRAEGGTVGYAVGFPGK